MSEERNLYQILGLPVGSKDVAIKRAYRRATFKYHPDTRSKELSAEENKQYDLELAEIIAAYEVLSDTEMKEAYDSVVTVLEEQENVQWHDDGFQSPGVWNVPPGNPMPFTSGSYNYYGQPFTSGSVSFYTAPTKQRFIFRIDDISGTGLGGISIGDVLNVSYSPYATIPTLGASVPPGTMLNIPCRVISARYGTAPGLPVYGDFELEEI